VGKFKANQCEKELHGQLSLRAASRRIRPIEDVLAKVDVRERSKSVETVPLAAHSHSRP
jgi:hypothetical protein